MIKLNSVCKYYAENVGLGKCDLEIRDGETVGILGANGAGKSTMLKLIAGLIQPTHGTVEIDGKPPEKLREDISYISEAGSYFTSMNGWEHMEMLARFYPRFDKTRFVKLMDFFNLPINKKAATMSKGERSKLECALGFSKGARILLLDEPFLGKDIFTRRDFLKSAAALLDGETLLVATHEIGEIESFIERAVIISGGQVRADVSLDELHESGLTLEAKLAEVCGYDPSRALKML